MKPTGTWFERAFFASRWLVAPFYVGMIASLLLLLAKFAQEAVHMVSYAFAEEGTGGVAVGVLSLVDLSLMANLVLMVMFAGYESFVSRLDIGEETQRLTWMGRVGFGDLKLRLMASIVAISAIHLLSGFLNVHGLSDRELAWQVGIHMAFVVSGLILAAMDRMSERTEAHRP